MQFVRKEEEIILKWRSLDEYGQKAIMAILDIEYERCMKEIDKEVQ